MGAPRVYLCKGAKTLRRQAVRPWIAEAFARKWRLWANLTRAVISTSRQKESSVPDVRNVNPAEGMTGIPQEHYAEIGRVAEAWTAIELMIDTACWNLSGLSAPVGICLTSQVSGHARKMDAFISLARLRGADEGLVRELNHLAERARVLSEQRNRVIHDSWMVGASNVPHRMEASARRALKYRYVPVTTEQLTELTIGSCRTVSATHAECLVWMAPALQVAI